MKTLAKRIGWASVLASLLGLGAGSGCTTEAYCYTDCPDDTTKDTTSGTSQGGGGGSSTITGAGGEDCFPNCGTTSTTGGDCTPDGDEVCDGKDNDCNDEVDDVPAGSLTEITACGACDNDCTQVAYNCELAGIKCESGACACDKCADDYFDNDDDPADCEYYCVKSADDDKACNNKDDDCDGVKDEDVDVCKDTNNCGKCGSQCTFLHATAECVHEGNDPCAPVNTGCQLKKCDCSGPDDCWWNLDNSDVTGCEYKCFPDPKTGGVEVCGDGIDNDCDGKIDDADDLKDDPEIGKPCFGDPDGECATVAHQGKIICKAAKYTCDGVNVIKENEELEVCDGKDNDCDGVIDDSPTDAGGACGKSNIFPCQKGTFACENGALTCVGAIDPGVEVCNGVDDDCDGAFDKAGANQPSDATGDCDVPPDPPAGAKTPCKKGSKACVGGVVVCQGSVGPSGPVDGCGEDSNCDGVLGSQPDLMTDVAHCGACGNDCAKGAAHAVYECKAGACSFKECEKGYYDLDGDDSCEYACVFIQAQETCNGIDDNCDGKVDENVVAPSPTQVCGVKPGVTAKECTDNVTVKCTNGSWKCTFPANVCSPTCEEADETCDALDNDCNGVLNENVPGYGKPCASDDGLPPPGHGACKQLGTFVCNGLDAVQCSAKKGDCNDLPGGCTEKCDGVDNDCDGLTDEPFTNKGGNATYFVKPTVTKVSNTRWVYSYEASRPDASDKVPGDGNGYHTSAPAGATLDKTPSCSAASRIPWFNVTPQEVEQTCTAAGGFICTTTDWQTACRVTPFENPSCKWGYSPRGADCKSTFIASKYCNLGPSFDFSVSSGDQDGLLPTASNLLKNCAADWNGLLGNDASTKSVFDITGNLREITKKAAGQYTLMGGAFNTQEAGGATCDFTFYTVAQTFKYFDTGFRCCFSNDPTQ